MHSLQERNFNLVIWLQDDDDDDDENAHSSTYKMPNKKWKEAQNVNNVEIALCTRIMVSIYYGMH